MALRCLSRSAAARSLPQLRAAALPALAPARRGLASSAPAVDASGRTPERTAELERLAEQHNGFLFGELVRARTPVLAGGRGRGGLGPGANPLTP